MGAALELVMIKWTVGETNFYRTFKWRLADNIARDQLAAEELAEFEGQK
jgi:hypothetical protein